MPASTFPTKAEAATPTTGDGLGVLSASTKDNLDDELLPNTPHQRNQR